MNKSNSKSTGLINFDIPDKEEFDDGMVSMRVGSKLQWVLPEQYIEVDDLPESLIASIKDLPFYASATIVQQYLNDPDKDINEGWS